MLEIPILGRSMDHHFSEKQASLDLWDFLSALANIFLFIQPVMLLIHLGMEMGLG